MKVMDLPGMFLIGVIYVLKSGVFEYFFLHGMNTTTQILWQDDPV